MVKAVFISSFPHTLWYITTVHMFTYTLFKPLNHLWLIVPGTSFQTAPRDKLQDSEGKVDVFLNKRWKSDVLHT